MKIRNKKTWGVVDFLAIDLTSEDGIEFVFVTPDGDEQGLKYNSLEAFTEEWEDYVPAEPLIKDEKIRKAVRAWAEVNELLIFKVVNEHFNCSEIIGYGDHNIGASIGFKTTIAHANKNQLYTLAELCGEEEE